MPALQNPTRQGPSGNERLADEKALQDGKAFLARTEADALANQADQQQAAEESAAEEEEIAQAEQLAFERRRANEQAEIEAEEAEEEDDETQFAAIRQRALEQAKTTLKKRIARSVAFKKVVGKSMIRVVLQAAAWILGALAPILLPILLILFVLALVCSPEAPALVKAIGAVLTLGGLLCPT